MHFAGKSPAFSHFAKGRPKSNLSRVVPLIWSHQMSPYVTQKTSGNIRKLHGLRFICQNAAMARNFTAMCEAFVQNSRVS
jgi:hypothetical protein